MTADLNMAKNKIINLAAPVNAIGAVNKQYTDDNFLKASGGGMTSNINMRVGYKITKYE